MSDQTTEHMTDDQLAEYEEKMAGDDFSNKAPRKAKHFWPSAKRLLGLLAPFKAALIAVFVMNAASVLLGVYAPRVMGQAVDVIFTGAMSHGVDFERLRTLILIVLGLYVGASILMWAQGAILNRLTMRAVFDLRERVEAKINRLPLRYFDTRQRGDVMSRTTNDVDNVQQALQQSLSSLFNALLTVVGILVMMFAISWQLALVALLSLPLTGLIMAVVGTRSQKQFTTQWKATGDVNGHVEESFSGHDVALIFGRTDQLREEFAKRNEELAGAAQKAQFLANSMHPIMQFVSLSLIHI